MICEKCGELFEKDWRKYPKGNPRFCSERCSRSFSSMKKRKEINKKVSLKLKKYPDCFCKICNKKISHRNNTKICWDCRSKYKKYDNHYYYIKDYRKKLKEKSIEYKGGCCVICGYNKCYSALEFHHIDKNLKDFSISTRINKKWETLKKELDKCILVCVNCHRELHEGIVQLTI